MVTSWPDAEPASPEYAYVDPKNSHYGMARLGDSYHPLEVFDKFERPGHKFGAYLFYPFYSSTIGILAVAWFHLRTRRPFYSQIWKYGVALGGGSLLGDQIFKYNARVSNRKDAILRHYMEIHKEDFPVVHRYKYKDLFKPWLPIRS